MKALPNTAQLKLPAAGASNVAVLPDYAPVPKSALGRLYATIGLDPEPTDLATLDIATLGRSVDQLMAEWRQATPVPPPGQPAPPPDRGRDF